MAELSGYVEIMISPPQQPCVSNHPVSGPVYYLELCHAAPVLGDAPDGARVAHARVRDEHRVEARLVDDHLVTGVLHGARPVHVPVHVGRGSTGHAAVHPHLSGAEEGLPD